MWSKLVAILNSLQKGFLKNIFAGAGIAFTSAAIFMAAFASAVNAFKNSLGGIQSDVLALAHLAGFDIAISIILAAVVTRLTLNSSNLMLRKQ